MSIDEIIERHSQYQRQGGRMRIIAWLYHFYRLQQILPPAGDIEAVESLKAAQLNEIIGNSIPDSSGSMYSTPKPDDPREMTEILMLLSENGYKFRLAVGNIIFSRANVNRAYSVKKIGPVNIYSASNAFPGSTRSFCRSTKKGFGTVWRAYFIKQVNGKIKPFGFPELRESNWPVDSGKAMRSVLFLLDIKKSMITRL